MAELARVRADVRGAYEDLLADFGRRDNPGGGDCFYYTLFGEFDDRLPQQLRAGDRHAPTAAEIRGLREALAAAVREAFDAYNAAAALDPRAEPSEVVHGFAEAWGEQIPPATRRDRQAAHVRIIATMGDYTAVVRRGVESTASAAPVAAAWVWGLPMTVLHGSHVVHVGPQGQPPVGYVYYTGEHYMVVRPGAGVPILPAADLVPVVAEQPVALGAGEVVPMVGAYAAAVADLAAGVAALGAAADAADAAAAEAGRWLTGPVTAVGVAVLDGLHRQLTGLVAPAAAPAVGVAAAVPGRRPRRRSGSAGTAPGRWRPPRRSWPRCATPSRRRLPA